MAKFLWPENRQEKSLWKKVIQKEKLDIKCQENISVFQVFEIILVF